VIEVARHTSPAAAWLSPSRATRAVGTVTVATPHIRQPPSTQTLPGTSSIGGGDSRTGGAVDATRSRSTFA